MLPPDVARQAIASGWVELHPVAVAGMAPENLVMIYSPRDEQEVNVIFALLQAAYRYAGGRLPEHIEKTNPRRKKSEEGIQRNLEALTQKRETYSQMEKNDDKDCRYHPL